jgi:hypothetical protein
LDLQWVDSLHSPEWFGALEERRCLIAVRSPCGKQRTNPFLMMTMVLPPHDPPVTVFTPQPMQIPRLQSVTHSFVSSGDRAKMTRKEKNPWL